MRRIFNRPTPTSVATVAPVPSSSLSPSTLSSTEPKESNNIYDSNSTNDYPRTLVEEKSYGPYEKGSEESSLGTDTNARNLDDVVKAGSGATNSLSTSRTTSSGSNSRVTMTTVNQSKSNNNNTAEHTSLEEVEEEFEDDGDYVKLSTASTARLRPTLDPPEPLRLLPRSHSLPQRTASSSSSSGTNARIRPRTQARRTGSNVSVNSTRDREAIMTELLSGQAAVDAKSYTIMDWDEMQETRKEHDILTAKLNSLSRTLALETKLRDSAAKLVRLSGSSSKITAASSSSSSSSSNLPRAEAQLATASAKVEELSKELERVRWLEASARTKLLEHNVGVLALAVKRTEDVNQTIERSSSFGPSSGTTRSLPPEPQPQSQSQSPSTAYFDDQMSSSGPRETTSPPTSSSKSFSSPFAQSPFASPQLDSAQGPLSPPLVINPEQNHQSVVRELQAQVSQLKEQLASSQTELDQRTLADSDRDRELKELRSEANQAKQSLEDARIEIEGLNREMNGFKEEKAGEEVSASVAEIERLNQRLTALTNEHEEVRQRASTAESRVSELSHEVEEHKRTLEEANEQQLRRQDDVSERLADAERKLQAQSLSASEGKKRLVQAVRDVLRRHRTRPSVGPALREVSSFDESVLLDLDGDDSDAAASCVSTVLNGHFECLSSHVSKMETDLDLLRKEKEATELILQQANENIDQLRSEVGSHRQAKDSLQVEHDDLKARLQEQLAASLDTSTLENELAQARAEESKANQGLVMALEQVSKLEDQLSEVNSAHTRSLGALQDLWRSIPALEARVAASGSEDLSVLKAAFEAPKKPMGNFLADVTANKFSIEGFVEQVRVLLIEDSKLVSKLVAYESEKGVHVEKAERASKGLVEATGKIESLEKQVKELEERMEISANQEVSMLERLNDLTESLERNRAEKRKIEIGSTNAQAHIKALEEEKVRLNESLVTLQLELSELSKRPDLSTKVAELESEVSELRDEASDLKEELEDAKKREQKQRTQLLQQLSEAEQEASSLKTLLRQEQRKQSKT